MFRRVLIANRGEIACRIQRTLGRMGIESVAVYSEADRHAPHVKRAAQAVLIGPAPASESYLRGERILDAAVETGAEAIHPGYGFLSENASFARACQRRGVRFIGPRPEQVEAFGLKHVARALAIESGVPVVPGSPLLSNVAEAIEEAERIGYPVMLKSTAGGGGIGMRRCADRAALADAFESVGRMAEASFGERGLFVEKLIEPARHVEVQIFGCNGEVVALGERDCSLQRRNQKVVEETPAPGLREEVRFQMHECAAELGRRAGYRSAGTVEFLLDPRTEKFYFLEVNTRLQVEHGVTEAVLGIDLVEWMIREAAGEDLLASSKNWRASGAAIEARVYAEDPLHGFRPSSGLLTAVRFPGNVRVDTWIETGTDVMPYYDPLLAKVIVRAETRADAVAAIGRALRETRIDGIRTNLALLREAVGLEAFERGEVETSLLNRVIVRERVMEVTEPGMQTSVQDFPGRVGYWQVGVPPSGPMDWLAHRLANRIVGNDASAGALEMTMIGPTLLFFEPARIVLAGANTDATLDGEPVEFWTPIDVPRGSSLRVGKVSGHGARAYLAVAGGFDAAPYLGSAATFMLGGFGGHAGRALRKGDMLGFGEAAGNPCPLPGRNRPAYSNKYEIGVLCGPHGVPDFFMAEYLDRFFETDWTVHFHSDRTGVRLVGPKPGWARTDGGEAGLHPSNLHDNAYAIGAIDFTGDMPILLGPDGPSLGGFVSPAVVAHAELWKLGQLRAGDTVRFRAITNEAALAMDAQIENTIADLRVALPRLPEGRRTAEIVSRKDTLVTRADGDRYLLFELGPNKLDLETRLRIDALQRQVETVQLDGILDVTPGIRSLQIHYNPRRLSREKLLSTVEEAFVRTAGENDIEIPARTVWLPLSWDDPAAQEAVARYARTVRPDAPWAPSNIEFIRRINGLDEDDVRRIVYSAKYVVLGLGDVYLGAPVATPLDARHRLVTTKYNPARTWTPQNAVGIGGAYMCIYGMEGPGGYQLVGRTVQVWNTWRTTKLFEPGHPWLLRFFDQIHFYPVSAPELLEMRDAFPHGGFEPRIEATTFRLSDYRRFALETRDEADRFRARREAAFAEELARWKLLPPVGEIDRDLIDADDALPRGAEPVHAPVTASVWRVDVGAAERVEAGHVLVVLEAMKTEIAITAPGAGVIERVLTRPGALVTAGQTLVFFRRDAA